MTGLEVISGISAVIGIIDASIKVYINARNGMKLPKSFKSVGHQLLIIFGILQTCENDLQQRKVSMRIDVSEALEEIFDACDDKARKLREIFEEIMPSDNDTWERQYSKVIRRFGKGSKVEELMEFITEDVQLVVNNQAVRSARPEQNAELENITEKMNSIKASAPEEESSAMAFHSGGGAQKNNVNEDSGQQINNNASVGTQNFNSGSGKNDNSP